MRVAPLVFLFFFFNDTATTEIYTLSLHDALPISEGLDQRVVDQDVGRGLGEQRRLVQGDLRERLTTEKIRPRGRAMTFQRIRSEEHTSELQSRSDLVCRLLLEKKKKRRVPA